MKQANVLALFFTLLGWMNCVKIIFEKTTLDYVNPTYLSEVKFYIHRYGRKSGYYLNIEGHVLAEWNTNVTFHAIFYEYLNNEYRRSFVEMHYNFCDLVNKDILVGPMLRATGIVECPLAPIKYLLHNLTVPTEHLPFIWPFERSRMHIEINQTSSKEALAIGNVYVKFQKDLKKKGR